MSDPLCHPKMTFLHSLNVNHVTIIAAGFVAVFYCYSRFRSLHSNIAAAKSTGFDYVVLPFHMLGAPWMVLQDLIIPSLQLLPRRWTERWFA